MEDRVRAELVSTISINNHPHKTGHVPAAKMQKTRTFRDIEHTKDTRRSLCATRVLEHGAHRQTHLPNGVR